MASPSQGDMHVETVAWRRRLEARLRRTTCLVVLLGAAGQGLDERRAIARGLERCGIVAIIPEDHLPPGIGPSLGERALLARADVDLVFLNVESWGAATELGQFHGDRRIAHKLRILVPPEHHPFHGGDGGYLADLYLTHLAAFGHVYARNGGRKVPVLPAAGIIAALSERHQQIKALNRNLIK